MVATLQVMGKLTPFSNSSKAIFHLFGAEQRGQALGTTAGVRNLFSALWLLGVGGQKIPKSSNPERQGPVHFIFLPLHTVMLSE